MILLPPQHKSQIRDRVYKPCNPPLSLKNEINVYLFADVGQWQHILPSYLKIPSAGLPRNWNQAYHLKDWFSDTDLPTTPKRQKMWDSEPRAGKSSREWVKSSEVSQISKRKDFQLGLLVLEVT